MTREGSLHIVWLNRGQQTEPQYSVGFADYRSSGGAMKMRRLSGGNELVGFLTREVRVHPDVLASAVNGLRDEGNASIFNVVLSDEELTKLGLK
jgi:hypothetical protein